MTGDLILWMFAFSLLATCLASIGARALRGCSRHALVRICRERGQNDLLGDIMLRHDGVALGVESAQVVATAAMILSGGFIVMRRINALQLDDVSMHLWLYGLVGLLLLLLVEIWAPRVVVKLWGAGFLVRTWNAWKIISRVMLPFTKIELSVEALLARLLGREQSASSDELFEEEIRNIVSKGRDEGLLEHEARDMIEGVIDLADATVAQIMTPRTDMVCLPSSATLDEAIKVVIDSAHTRIPVFDRSPDDVVGVLYVRDLLPELLPRGEPSARPLGEIIRKPFFVPESKPVNALLQELQHNRNHLAIVLDEFGGVSGLVTIEDALEEIVGEIVDEHDEEEQDIHRIDERSAECQAQVHLYEVNKQLNIALPETGEFDTIGGFVFHELGHLPKPGEELAWGNIKITVLEVSRRRVERLRIEVLDATPTES
ncbi:MAG: hemolysin family protein [Pirellulales bacterium]